MNSGSARRLAAGLAALAAGLVAGCGVGPGEAQQGTATLTISHDFGADVMLESTVTDPPASLTVLRMLDDVADIETRYGGGFVQSIAGTAGGATDGRRHDWFFYVNGVESPIGAAEAEVAPGDRVWWDERDWTTAMRVPAVVGSWPQPLAGSEEPVVLDCRSEAGSCDAAADRLDAAGIDHLDGDAGDLDPAAPAVLVATWDQLSEEPAGELLAAGPQRSGVFARFATGGLALLDKRGEPGAVEPSGAGLVAAVRDGENEPVWIVAGTDAEGVERAIALLGEGTLRDRYAVAAVGSDALPLPLPLSAEGDDG